MSSIPAILQASLEPQTRQVAEKQLEELSSQPGFVILLIQIVLDNIQTPQARQAAAVYFKNTIKRRWSDVSYPAIPAELWMEQLTVAIEGYR
jgi:exportin-2 (importin alpha re-exporter)